jgi:endo-1,3-1,4-beta-glycanase ExoK
MKDLFGVGDETETQFPKPKRSRAQRFRMCASRLVVAFLVAAAAGAAAQEPERGFVDRFAGLDLKRWYISHGWANGPHQNCTWTESNLKFGNLVELSLTDTPSKDRPFTCAELQSNAYYGYGTYEVRARTAAGKGLVSAFFSYTGPPHGHPHDEIDFEFLGKEPGEVFLNYFVNGKSHSETAKLGFDATTGMHDYAFEWLPDSLRWFAGGRLIREVKASDGKPLPTTPQKIYISIWNGTGWDQEAWLGPFSYPGRPLKATFEYIAFTPAGAPCQFPQSIVCKRSDGKDPKR